ncbi:hypothetical protein LL240_11150 [Oceanimonas baumannii]|uniref:hypothetical protein n=1 Tax=Oceanimonas baumannii TaxID=129578 RepID=UPI001D189714|nr:hypothetical protein [Oceanimonas baumannii]MCC4265002.1 hypothetical protein [Oceanimonas baumannii]
MAGIGLKRGRLAILLVLLVGILCLGQRIGMMSYCLEQPQLTHTDDSSSQNSHERCSLSEQLLTKFWDHPGSLLLGLITLFFWWLTPPRRHGRRRVPPPEPVPEYRRHLLLCVFRE